MGLHWQSVVYKKMQRRKRCTNCGELLNAICFTAMMTQEWIWTGEGYNECSAHNSLDTDPQANVICPHCETVVGTGFDFGFAGGKEGKKVWERIIRKK